MGKEEKKNIDGTDQIRRQVMARRDAEAEQIKNDNGSGGIKIDSRFIRDCLNSNELGDGVLYSALHQGHFIFNKSADEWFSWMGHHWVIDIMDFSKAAVETVAERYLKEAHEIINQIDQASQKKDADLIKKLQDLQKKIYKRVGRLRSDRGRGNCLKFAHTNKNCTLAINGEEFDIHPWLLACRNGVIDLQTGDLRDGRPDDYLCKASPVEWKGIAEPAPLWEKSLLEMFKGKQDLAEYIGRVFGYGITGLSVEHILPVFWGAKGRNGKGTIIEILKYVLGPLAAPVPSEMLLDQFRGKSSAGPSPDVMALRGLRIAFASETDEGRRFSASKVKWLSGADTLVGRNPHDKFLSYFSPTHTLFLMTNDKPGAPSDDYAFWERVHLIPFELSFVDRKLQQDYERPANKHLPEKLKKEASGILAWLVRGCLQWQKQGLAPPQVVQDATAEYRRNEDILSDFIDDSCYLDKHAEVGASKLYLVFVEWWENNISKKAPSQKKFGRMMTKRYPREKKGTYKYFGLGLIE